MAVVDFSVKNQKSRVVDQRSNNGFWIRPRSILVKVFCQFVETILVTGVQFIGVTFVELFLKVQNEIFNSLRNMGVLVGWLVVSTKNISKVNILHGIAVVAEKLPAALQAETRHS